MESKSARLIGHALCTLIAFVMIADGLWAQHGPWRLGEVQKVIETPYGDVYKIYNPKPAIPKFGGGPPSFTGEPYSFQHQLGALIDDVFQCFNPHQAGMEDNTVLFDGLSELLDPYIDGTQPAVFEFETDNGDGTSNAFVNSFTESGGDLFPEGFEDPKTKTPLTDICLEIGIGDSLLSDIPADVITAIVEGSGDKGSIIPPTDITDFFDDPWDGRLSLIFSGLAGQDINGMTLDIDLQPSNNSNIFSDGFESGDATSWTDEVP